MLVGPHAHVNGATIEDEVFLATGAAVFPGATVGHGAEVRIHGVVQVNTTLEPGERWKLPVTLRADETATLSVPRRLRGRVGLVFTHATQARVLRRGVRAADTSMPRMRACAYRLGTRRA